MRMLAGGVLLALAACQALPSARSHLTGEWRVVALDGRAVPGAPEAYAMNFERARIGARFGCNNIGGTYRMRGTTLTTNALAMTEMYCGDAAAAFESRGVAIMGQPMTMSGSSGRLRLSNSVGTIELERAR